jgi:hypothetical protein
MQILTSDNRDLILKKLKLAKKEMKSIIKDANNTFHKSKYATLGAYIEAVEDALDNHNLMIFQQTTQEEGKNEYTLVTTLEDLDSGQWMKSFAPLINTANNCQGLGSAITYMRRYSLSAMLGLYPEDDDGETADGRGRNAKKEPKQPTQKPISVETTTPSPVMEAINEEEFKELMGLLSQVTQGFKHNLEDLLIAQGVNGYKYMTKHLFKEQKPLIMAHINERKKNKMNYEDGVPF